MKAVSELLVLSQLSFSAAGSLRMQSRHQFYESLQLAEELMRRIDASWPRDRVPGKN
jgi:hypothetical protein